MYRKRATKQYLMDLKAATSSPTHLKMYHFSIIQLTPITRSAAAYRYLHEKFNDNTKKFKLRYSRGGAGLTTKIT